MGPSLNAQCAQEGGAGRRPGRNVTLTSVAVAVAWNLPAAMTPHRQNRFRRKGHDYGDRWQDGNETAKGVFGHG